MMSHETYAKPPHGWTCFHCGETFTTIGMARDHFGATPDAQPGCMERVRLGGERGLLRALREAEARISEYMNEDADTIHAMQQMQNRHGIALEDAEISGYERGLRDGRAEASNALPVSGEHGD